MRVYAPSERTATASVPPDFVDRIADGADYVEHALLGTTGAAR